MFRYLAVSAILVARLAVAGEAPQNGPSPGDQISLSDADLRAITLNVLEKNPILASSPGIKVAFAWRGVGTSEGASIVFHPHLESAGIKQAFQAQCRRESPTESWACEYVTLRRYVKLESQDFELRVKGDLNIDSVHALVQATRAAIQANTPEGAAIPEITIIMLPVGDGYLVGWGDGHGNESLEVMAELRKGGDPTVAEDWQTVLMQPEE